MTRALLVALVLCAGCRAAHETAVLQRVTQVRLAQTLLPRTLGEADALVLALPRGERRELELRLKTEATQSNGTRTWCLTLAELDGCFDARAVGDRTAVTVTPGSTPSGPLTHALWALLDPVGVSAASAEVTPDEISQLADDEEATFVPQWAPMGGFKSGAVTSSDVPAFTFAAHVGVHRWVSYFLMSGVGVGAEVMLQRERTVFALTSQARLDISVWRDDNVRYLNLPNLSFLMAVEPIFAFGQQVAVGARAVVGVQLVHLTNFPTPVVFEFGFQALSVDKVSASGLRVALCFGI